MKRVFLIASYEDYDLINERMSDISNYFLNKNDNYEITFPYRYLIKEKVLNERKKITINENKDWVSIVFNDTGKSYLVNCTIVSKIRDIIKACGYNYISYLENKELYDFKMIEESDSYIVINNNDVLEKDLIKKEIEYASSMGLEEIVLPSNILYGNTKKL